MGQCGCGDYRAAFKLPGPDGIWYAFQRHRGCRDCGVVAGVIVYRHDAEGARTWDVERLPNLPVYSYDEEGGVEGECAIPVLDATQLQDRIAEAFAEVYASDDELTAEDAVDLLSDVVPEAVFRVACSIPLQPTDPNPSAPSTGVEP
jgi:hypothetical protein